MYSNSQILSAVLAKWGSPIVSSIFNNKMYSIPFLTNLESKIINTGWVGRGWSLSKDLCPIIENISEQLVTPIIDSYLNKIPQDTLPILAHNLVDSAIKNNGLSILEGNITFSVEDLKELKRLLNYNLPISISTNYIVKENTQNEYQDDTRGTITSI